MGLLLLYVTFFLILVYFCYRLIMYSITVIIASVEPPKEKEVKSEVDMDKIGEMVKKAEDMRDDMAAKVREIERLVEKAKGTGEELPPELLEEFREGKKDLAAITGQIDDINQTLRRVRTYGSAGYGLF